MKKHLLFNIKLYTIILIISLTISFLSLSITNSFGDSKYKKDYYYEYYIVRTNDTIWNIAEKFNTFKIDIRDFISIIIEENEIKNSLIFPGEKLKIPII